jgi:hypothetical protein
MKNRHTFLSMLAASVVALALVAGSALAAELLGTITKVDVEGKKLTVIENDTDKEVPVSVTDDTEWVTPKASSKIDLEKVSKNLTKAIEKGRKGVNVSVIHEKGVASKITVAAKKQ